MVITPATGFSRAEFWSRLITDGARETLVSAPRRPGRTDRRLRRPSRTLRRPTAAQPRSKSPRESGSLAHRHWPFFGWKRPSDAPTRAPGSSRRSRAGERFATCGKRGSKQAAGAASGTGAVAHTQPASATASRAPTRPVKSWAGGPHHARLPRSARQFTLLAQQRLVNRQPHGRCRSCRTAMGMPDRPHGIRAEPDVA